jgi:hypothetical protein
MFMNEQELNAIVDAKLEAELAARLAADRQRVKMQVVDQIRREAERAHYARINARHPIENKYSGLTAEQHEARIAAMRAGAARDAEHMARVNSRPVEGSLVHQRKQAALTPGSEGFAIKPVGQR